MSILKQGHKFLITDFDHSYEQLPEGNYLLQFNDREGFHLIKKEEFKLPSKIYGNHSIVDRWLKSWDNNTEKNMGVILSGLKGSGKTITAQKFCIEAKLPVIMVTADFGSELNIAFINFLTNPKLGKFICFIDEFEKIYESDGYSNSTNGLLQIMDGSYPTNIIFLLTCNEFKISEYLINRLNRVKYRKHYESLDQSTIDEVINDLLLDKKYAQSIYDVFDNIGIYTFDLLINIIREVNLFNEDANECVKHLNIEPTPRFYQIFEEVNGKELECQSKFINFQRLLQNELDIIRDWYYPNMELPKTKQIKHNKKNDYVGINVKTGDYNITKINGLKHFIIENKENKFIFKQSTISHLTI